MGAPLLLLALTLFPVAAAASLEPWDSLLLILGAWWKGLLLRGGAEGLHSLASQSWMVGAWLPGRLSRSSSCRVLGTEPCCRGSPQCWLVQELPCTHHKATEATGVLPLFMLGWWGWSLVWGWETYASATESLASLASSHSLALCTHNWSIVDWAAVSWLVAGWWHREIGSSLYWAYSSSLVWKGA